MNEHVKDIFNYLCNNKYGGGMFADAEMELQDPDLYKLFEKAFNENDNDVQECEVIEWGLNDKLSFCKFLLECMVENDDGLDEVEIDHDLGYTTYSYKQIANFTLEAFEQYEKENN